MKYFVFLFGLLLIGCAQSADGPAFVQLQAETTATGSDRVYVYRDKVLYLVEAPYVRSAHIEIDGQTIGDLKNGGFITADVLIGTHYLTATSGGEVTSRYFNAAGNGVYVQVFDKTRMAGGRALAGGLTGGVVGGLVGAQSGKDSSDNSSTNATREAILAGAGYGAATGIIQGVSDGFSGNGLYAAGNPSNELDGRLWGVEFDNKDQAAPILATLRLSAFHQTTTSRLQMTTLEQVAQAPICSCVTYAGSICTAQCDLYGQRPMGCLCKQQSLK